jgi:predicted RNase H-like HicB family nuclease
MRALLKWRSYASSVKIGGPDDQHQDNRRETPDGYVAYPLGLSGVVVGEGDTYEEALADATSAILFHIETFGREALDPDSAVLEAFVAEATVAG